MQHEIRTLFHNILKPRGTQARMARLLGTTETTVGRWADLGGSPLDSFGRFFDALLTANRDGARIVLQWLTDRYRAVPFVGTWSPSHLTDRFAAVMVAEMEQSGPRALRGLYHDLANVIANRLEMLGEVIRLDDERRGAILAGGAA